MQRPCREEGGVVVMLLTQGCSMTRRGGRGAAGDGEEEVAGEVDDDS
jgi:hypothetical protein